MAPSIFGEEFYDEDFGSECLLTDDIWDKFELSSFDTLLQHDIDLNSIDMFSNNSAYEIRNHDCMWAGHCGSKEHSIDDVKNILVMPLSQVMQSALAGAVVSCPQTAALVTPTTKTMKPPPPPPPTTTTVNPPPPPAAPVLNKQAAIAPGRSVLLKTQPQMLLQQQQQQQKQVGATQMFENQNSAAAAAAAAVPHYESPPNSDDEETKSSVLQYLQEAISECDMEDDDLYDYFEDNKNFTAEEFDGENADEEEDEEEEQDIKPDISELMITIQQQAANAVHPPIPEKKPVIPKSAGKNYSRAAISQFVNDHCYHKDKNASMRNLGLDTPSDSEEEIDVVSTDDKRSTSALPTNPTTRDRHQIQQTMASAINKNGIRTIPPVKTSSPSNGINMEQDSPSKRRSEMRGIKRNRHRGLSSPYKKHHQQQQQQQQLQEQHVQPRAYHLSSSNQVSSDSEQEPSGKRLEHNNMERQRRIDLRNAFEELRVLVPEVGKRERAPKVVILREAAVYCHSLTDYSDAMRRQKDELRRQQKRLRTHLSQLRTNLASQNVDMKLW